SYLQAEADSDRDVARFERLEPWTRVSLKDYRENITQMVALSRACGAQPILLYNELWENGFYLAVLHEIARKEDVPLVDGNAEIVEERRRKEEALEGRLRLARQDASAAPEGKAEVIFRVLADNSVAKPIYIAGADPQLGDRVPNKVLLYDDGTH